LIFIKEENVKFYYILIINCYKHSS